MTHFSIFLSMCVFLYGQSNDYKIPYKTFYKRFGVNEVDRKKSCWKIFVWESQVFHSLILLFFIK